MTACHKVIYAATIIKRGVSAICLHHLKQVNATLGNKAIWERERIIRYCTGRERRDWPVEGHGRLRCSALVTGRCLSGKACRRHSERALCCQFSSRRHWERARSAVSSVAGLVSSAPSREMKRLSGNLPMLRWWHSLQAVTTGASTSIV